MFVQQNLINFIEAEKGKRWGGFAVLENHKGAAKSGSYEPQSSLHRPRLRPTTASAVDYADKPACLAVIWIQTLSDTDYALCMLPPIFSESSKNLTPSYGTGRMSHFSIVF